LENINEVDKQCGVSKKALAAVEVGVKKAGEIDEQHGITDKATVAVGAGVQKADKGMGRRYNQVDKCKHAPNSPVLSLSPVFVMTTMKVVVMVIATVVVMPLMTVVMMVNEGGDDDDDGGDDKDDGGGDDIPVGGLPATLLPVGGFGGMTDSNLKVKER
jgi:hypothetical protein